MQLYSFLICYDDAHFSQEFLKSKIILVTKRIGPCQEPGPTYTYVFLLGRSTRNENAMELIQQGNETFG